MFWHVEIFETCLDTITCKKNQNKGFQMQTIQINNSELEQYINLTYGDDKNSLVNDFVMFLKTELHASNIKKAFDEVKQFQDEKIDLTDASDFLKELKSDN